MRLLARPEGPRPKCLRPRTLCGVRGLERFWPARLGRFAQGLRTRSALAIGVDAGHVRVLVADIRVPRLRHVGKRHGERESGGGTATQTRSLDAGGGDARKRAGKRRLCPAGWRSAGKCRRDRAARQPERRDQCCSLGTSLHGIDSGARRMREAYVGRPVMGNTFIDLVFCLKHQGSTTGRGQTLLQPVRRRRDTAARGRSGIWYGRRSRRLGLVERRGPGAITNHVVAAWSRRVDYPEAVPRPVPPGPAPPGSGRAGRRSVRPARGPPPTTGTAVPGPA